MKICVIKAGSAIVTQDNNMLDLNTIQNICHQIIKLNTKGWRIILVSSGAVACGKGTIEASQDIIKRHKSYADSILASLGQGRLIYYYSSFLNTNSSNLDVGQILVNRVSLSFRENYTNLKKIILGMLDSNIIPIINENDALGLKGINFLDNDQLASIIAIMVRAKACLLLSDVGAVYTKNPKLYKDAKKLSEIDINNANIEIDDSNSSRGGMKSKIDVFKLMSRFGIQCILSGKNDISLLCDIVDGTTIKGTRLKLIKEKRYSITKEWLGTSAIPKGMVLISSAGADVMAGRTEKNSKSNLYSIGICGYLGNFGKGDIVSVRDEQLNLIGIGKSKCSSSDLQERNYGSVFIHENDFFQLSSYPFNDLDMIKIKSTLKQLRKRLLSHDDERFIIAPISADIDLKTTKIEEESIVISREKIKKFLTMFKYAKLHFSLTFDEWLIYCALEGFYEKETVL